jgi:hypothetical protein
MNDDSMPYQNREIKELFKAADDRADAFHDKLMERMSVFEGNTTDSLDRIESQTVLTNGKVADINKWRERANGGAMVAGIFMSVIVIPILAWAIYVLVNIHTTIQQSVDAALSVYNINTK